MYKLENQWMYIPYGIGTLEKHQKMQNPKCKLFDQNTNNFNKHKQKINPITFYYDHNFKNLKIRKHDPFECL